MSDHSGKPIEKQDPALNGDEPREDGSSRRQFLQMSLMTASAFAASSLLPSETEAQSCGLPGGDALETIQAITPKANNTLRATLVVANESKSYPNPSATSGLVCNSGQMRYFTGYNTADGSQEWPPAKLKGKPTPGPTLETSVGGKMEITLMNHVDVSQFNVGTIDLAETGQRGGCDYVTQPGTGGSGPTVLYPGTAAPGTEPQPDTFPDCFHASSTANLHFHGTHVSPSNIGDNIMVQIRPSPRPSKGGKPIVDKAFLHANGFNDILAVFGATGKVPQKWQQLPPKWQAAQQKLLMHNDASLPPASKLWPADKASIDAGFWPDYYIGAYPNCLALPEWDGKVDSQGQPLSMGQAPGTHWYHSHKHGSVALNLANGMFGALIIRGKYDKDLAPYIDGEKVLVFGQFSSQLNLERAGRTGPDPISVNGQYQPVLTMRPGEIQLWRIVNASHQSAAPLAAPTGGLQWIATAHDGVQLSRNNYAAALSNLAAPQPILAPANRLDLLVQAPSSPTAQNIPVQTGGTTLFSVKVDGTKMPNAKQFPTKDQFPEIPGFLATIPESYVVNKREVRFKTTPGVGKTNNLPPYHLIDGKKFDSTIAQCVKLGAIEEWTIYNEGGPAHPFHIHVNPFQVIEFFDPNKSATPIDLSKDPVWWDTFPLPTANGTTPGHIKMRTRFFDYAGLYVLHCHILAHEDRGMMQLVEVSENGVCPPLPSYQSHH